MPEKHQIDMCQGSILRKIILFALPLLATNVLQLLFNSADMVVLGRFAPHEAMAAVGATFNISGLFCSIQIGLGVGSNVLAARFFGAGDKEKLHRTVQTTVSIGAITGIGLMLIAYATMHPLLRIMGTPADIYGKSSLYLAISFMGIPFMVIYNVGCGILRAVGDTLRPLYFLIASGIANVALNMFFVIVFHMDVAGVAIATVIAQILPVILLLTVLMRAKDETHLDVRHLTLHGPTLREILAIGIPASIQSCCFAISNMTIQSAINSFGSYAVAGNTAAVIIEGLVYISSYAFHLTMLSFAAQNLGGRHFKRIIQGTLWCVACVIVCDTAVGAFFTIFAKQSLAFCSNDPEVIRWGLIRCKLLFMTYALCGVMDVLSGLTRGLGYSTLTTLAALSGAFFFRILWVAFILPYQRTYSFLLISYPISWILVICVNTVIVIYVLRKLYHERTIRHGKLYEVLQKACYRSGPPILRKGPQAKF